MQVVIQRVKQARVEVENVIVGQIDSGLLVFVGIDSTDTEAVVDKMLDKIINYRIFNDSEGKMNLNVKQVGGQLLVVSQFTLSANTQKGRRPNFSQSAKPEFANTLYRYLLSQSKRQIDTQAGEFGANMQVYCCNDGPVTFHFQIIATS